MYNVYVEYLLAFRMSIAFVQRSRHFPRSSRCVPRNETPQIEPITTATIPSYIFPPTGIPFATQLFLPLASFVVSLETEHVGIGRAEPIPTTLLAYAFPWPISSLFSLLSLCLASRLALFGHVKLKRGQRRCKCARPRCIGVVCPFRRPFVGGLACFCTSLPLFSVWLAKFACTPA